MSTLGEKCLKSWKEILPDYTLKRWDETNFDIDIFPYCREAYDKKKYAFVSDVARLFALYEEGGIYMDTDVEVLKPFDNLLCHYGFLGYEVKTRIQTGIIGCEKHAPLIKELYDEYQNIHFINNDGTLDLTPNVVRFTKILTRQGFVPNGEQQTISSFFILPTYFLCPKNPETLRLQLTDDSYCIHHFEGTWSTRRNKFNKWISNILGVCLTTFIQKYLKN